MEVADDSAAGALGAGVLQVKGEESLFHIRLDTNCYILFYSLYHAQTYTCALSYRL